MKNENIVITHPEKIIFPEIKVTKKALVMYYNKMAPKMLPYLKGRPLTLQRFPDGVAQNGFYQKHAQDYYPNFVDRIIVKTEEGKAEEIICNNRESLLYLANQGTVSFHAWLSQIGNLHCPDKVVFDLDPSEDISFAKVRKAARLVGKSLRENGIEPRLMTTGKSGIHIFYGILPSVDFDQVREEARRIAEQLVMENPDLFTLEMRKNKRGGKIFLDYLRNAYAQTSICPYSLRPNKNGGVATPLEWYELDKVKSGSQYSYTNIFRRLGGKK